MPAQGLNKEGQRLLLLAIEEQSNNFLTKDLFNRHIDVYGPYSEKRLKQLDDKRRWFLTEKEKKPASYWNHYANIVLGAKDDTTDDHREDSSISDDEDDATSSSSSDEDNSRSKNRTPASRATPPNSNRTPASRAAQAQAAASKKHLHSPPSAHKAKAAFKTPPNPSRRRPDATMKNNNVVDVNLDCPENNFPFIITAFRDKVINGNAVDGFKITRKNVMPRDVHADLYSLKYLSHNELLYTGPLVDGTEYSRKDAKSRVDALKDDKTYCEKMDLEEQILVGHLNRDSERNVHEVIIRFNDKTFFTTDHFMLPGELDSDEYAIFTVRYPFEYEWVKEGTEDQDEPEIETKAGIMTDIFWKVALIDAKNRELGEKPEKKLPKHMRGLSNRMKGMNIG